MIKNVIFFRENRVKWEFTNRVKRRQETFFGGSSSIYVNESVKVKYLKTRENLS